MEDLKVASAKTLHTIVGGLTDDGGEVIVGVGEYHGDFLGRRYGCHGGKGV